MKDEEKLKMLSIRAEAHKDIKFYALQENMTMMDFIEYLIELHEDQIAESNKHLTNRPKKEQT